VGPLSLDVGDEDAQPYFIWDIPVTYRELAALLRNPERTTRALWKARVLREARYQDVWKLLELPEVLADYPDIRKHLGRALRFWDSLIEGWRRDGLIPGST
jgi:hypothetical protein